MPRAKLTVWSLTGLVLCAMCLLVVAPLGAVIYEAMHGVTLADGIGHLFTRWLGTDAITLVSNTAELSLLASVFTLVSGSGIALLLHFFPPRGRLFVEPLLLLPFLLPPYLTAVAWSLLAGRGGLLQRALGFGGDAVAHGLYSLLGIAAVIALHLMPLAYVMTSAVLRRVDERLVDCALVHGASRPVAIWTAYRSILLPALSAVALIAFLAASEEFGVPKVLGSYAGIRVMSVAIEQAMSVWPINLPRAAGIGLLLASMGLLVWWFEQHLVKKSTAMPSSRVRRPTGMSTVAAILLAGVAGILPLAAIVITSLQKAVTNGLHEGNWSFEHYIYVLRSGSAGREALILSLTLSVLAASIGTALAVATVWAMERYPAVWARRLELLGAVPQAIPGVVLGTGLIVFWNAAWNILPVYGHGAILLMAYLSLTFPYALRYVLLGFAQAPAALSDAAAVHGAGALSILKRVRLPLAWPMLLGSATVIFAFSMRELAASILVQPPGMAVVSTYVYGQFDQGNAGDGMAMAVLGILSSAWLLGLVRWKFSEAFAL